MGLFVVYVEIKDGGCCFWVYVFSVGEWIGLGNSFDVCFCDCGEVFCFGEVW